MNNQSLLTKFLISVGAQVLIILLFLAYNNAIIAGGKDLYLRALPVDPTDLIRGDYVVMTYNISEAYSYQFKDGVKPYNGATVYVPLYQAGSKDAYISGMILTSKPTEMDLKENPNALYLKGTVFDGGRSLNNPLEAEYDEQLKMYGELRPVRIKYGIEEKFVQKGHGNVPFDKDVVAWVKVGDNGESTLHKLYVDGVEWK